MALVGFGNTAEADLLKLVFNNTTWANVGDATGIVGSTVPGSFYINLHTADPDETGDQTTSVTTYTGYAPVAVARSTGGWTVSGTAPTQVANAGAITFGLCTAGSVTLTHVTIGRASSGAGELIAGGALDNSLATGGNSTITPNFAIGTLVLTLG